LQLVVGVARSCRGFACILLSVSLEVFRVTMGGSLGVSPGDPHQHFPPKHLQLHPFYATAVSEGGFWGGPISHNSSKPRRRDLANRQKSRVFPAKIQTSLTF